RGVGAALGLAGARFRRGGVLARHVGEQSRQGVLAARRGAERTRKPPRQAFPRLRHGAWLRAERRCLAGWAHTLPRLLAQALADRCADRPEALSASPLRPPP